MDRKVPQPPPCCLGLPVMCPPPGQVPVLLRLRPIPITGYSSLPCIPHACSGRLASSSCLELSRCPVSAASVCPRPRVLLKAPTLAEMEEMNISEAREGRRSGGHRRFRGDKGFPREMW